jgi:hypothetical protein
MRRSLKRFQSSRLRAEEADDDLEPCRGCLQGQINGSE